MSLCSDWIYHPFQWNLGYEIDLEYSCILVLHIWLTDLGINIVFIEFAVLTNGCSVGGGFTGLWTSIEVMGFIDKLEIALSVQYYNNMGMSLELFLVIITFLSLSLFLFIDMVLGDHNGPRQLFIKIYIINIFIHACKNKSFTLLLH